MPTRVFGQVSSLQIITRVFKASTCLALTYRLKESRKICYTIKSPDKARAKKITTRSNCTRKIAAINSTFFSFSFLCPNNLLVQVLWPALLIGVQQTRVCPKLGPGRCCLGHSCRCRKLQNKNKNRKNFHLN